MTTLFLVYRYLGDGEEKLVYVFGEKERADRYIDDLVEKGHDRRDYTIKNKLLK